jgi:hypothetical protein
LSGNLPFGDGVIACGYNIAQLSFLLLEFVHFGHHVFGRHFADGQFVIDAIVQMLYVIVDGGQSDAY